MLFALVSFALDLPNMILGTAASRPRLAVLIAALTSVGALACGNLTAVPASLPTLTDSGTVYALNGAPAGAPTALHFFSGQLVPADANFLFDIAFDIDSIGRVVYMPQRVVASALASTHSVGLRTLPDSFEAVTTAPKTGYRADKSLVTTRNVVVVAQSQDVSTCGVSLTGSTLYAKIVVTSVDRATRQLKVRFTVDPNCGFVSFSPGIPKV